MRITPAYATAAASITSVLVALIGFWGRDKLHQIHGLVNSRLTEALDEIQELKDLLATHDDSSDGML